MTVLVVANPSSGGGAGALMLERLQGDSKVLMALGPTFCAGTTIVETDAQREWVVKARSICQSQDVRAIVAIGGDGTLSEVAQLAYEQSCAGGAVPPLVFLPGGRGNDLIRAVYGYSPSDGDFFRWLSQRAGWDLTSLDLVRANGRMFVNMASVGYGGQIVEKVHSRKAIWSKSSLVYQVEGALALFADEARCAVTVDGVSAFEGPMFGGFVGGGRANGSGLFWNPSASLNDGRIEGVVFSRPGVLGMARTLGAVKKGLDPVVAHSRFSGRRIVFTLDRKVAYEFDGEYIGQSARFEFECVPGAVRVFRPI